MLKEISDQLNGIPLLAIKQFYNVAKISRQNWNLQILRENQGKKLSVQKALNIQKAAVIYHNIFVDLLDNTMTDENYQLINEKLVGRYSSDDLLNSIAVLDTIDKRLTAYIAAANEASDDDDEVIDSDETADPSTEQTTAPDPVINPGDHYEEPKDDNQIPALKKPDNTETIHTEYRNPLDLLREINPLIKSDAGKTKSDNSTPAVPENSKTAQNSTDPIARIMSISAHDLHGK